MRALHHLINIVECIPGGFQNGPRQRKSLCSMVECVCQLVQLQCGYLYRMEDLLKCRFHLFSQSDHRLERIRQKLRLANPVQP